MPPAIARLARENDEGCLRCVFGIMPVMKNALAHAQHHWTMAAYEHCKGSLVLPSREAFKQFAIRTLVVLMVLD